MSRLLKYCLAFCMLAYCHPSFAQDQKIADSLAVVYNSKTLSDTDRLKMLNELSFNETRDAAKSEMYADEMILLSQQTNNDKYLRNGYFLKGNKNRMLGKLAEALHAYIQSAQLAEKQQDKNAQGESYCAIADCYSEQKNFGTAITYYQKALQALSNSKDTILLASIYLNSGDTYLKQKIYDSAFRYSTLANELFNRLHFAQGHAYAIGNMGMAQLNLGDTVPGEKNMQEANALLEKMQDYYPISVYLLSLADIQWNRGNKTKAFEMALRSYTLASQNHLNQQLSDASLKLSKFYEQAGNSSDALRYFKTHISFRDSVNNVDIVQRMADLRINYEVSQKQAEVNLLSQQKRDQRNLTIALTIILSLTIVLLGVLFKYNKNKQKAYAGLNLQKQETELQKAKAENALAELQSTQKMLVHAAKMASLGELTAGIAHEIQNPLNFVNNFSEVSAEILQELKDETLNKLPFEDKDYIAEIMGDLESNLRKITEHGKRADSIVRGMLEHSRVSSGKKEPTNINAFAEEYLRLSYHGVRAKDKQFNATLHAQYDASAPVINLIPQDLGRVLLNLYNNAFYAVKEKARTAGNDYLPLVTVTTQLKNNMVELRVKDNGTGIPHGIREKIFQPFFTTKPSGQGTGLGLSLSYDIIKAHDGEMIVNTENGEYTEFVIQLPA